jgi:hypothetical protein
MKSSDYPEDETLRQKGVCIAVAGYLQVKSRKTFEHVLLGSSQLNTESTNKHPALSQGAQCFEARGYFFRAIAYPSGVRYAA